MIEQSSEFLAAKVKPEEEKAIEMVWAKRGGVGTIPTAQAVSILAEVRERAARIEQSFLQTGLAALGEGRRTSRRHQRFALFAMCSAIAIAAAAIWLFNR